MTSKRSIIDASKNILLNRSVHVMTCITVTSIKRLRRHYRVDRISPMNITDHVCDLSKETAADTRDVEFQRVRNQAHSCLEGMQRTVVTRIVRLFRLGDRFNDERIQEILHDLDCTNHSVEKSIIGRWALKLCETLQVAEVLH